MRRQQKFRRWRFLRRREIAIDEKCLNDRKDETDEDERNKNSAALEELWPEEKLAEAGENRGSDNEVEAKVKDRIEQAAGEFCVP